MDIKNNYVRAEHDFIIINEQIRINKNRIVAIIITKQANSRRYPIFFGVIFLLISAISSSSVCLIISLLLFGLAILMRTKYALRIRTESGEIRPLASTNRSELEQIRDYIEKIIHE